MPALDNQVLDADAERPKSLRTHDSATDVVPVARKLGVELLPYSDAEARR